jgi:prepilin-type N-terminal cleavage/methylation domain-containing protein
MKRGGRRFEHRTRSGYTLMEMLIASVLIASLMSAAWNLLSLYTDFLSAGRDSAATQQLARSLFGIVSDDLQQVSLNDDETSPVPTVAPAFETVGFNAALNDQALDFGDESAEIQPPTSSFDLFLHSQGGPTVPGSLELIGTSSSLLVTRLRSPSTAPRTDPLSVNTLNDLSTAGLQDSSITGSSPSVPDIATIVYQFEASRISDGTARSLPGGLHRVEMESQQWFAAMQSRVDRDAGEDYELDRSTLESLLYGSSVDALLPMSATMNETLAEDAQSTKEPFVRSLQPQHEHIPEVVSCRFAFFDGSRWASNWDSRTSRALPRAVRIEFSLLTASDLQKVTASLQSGTIEEDELDQAQSEQPIESRVGANEAEFDADPFLAANPQRFERIILLSPRNVKKDIFEEAFPSAAGEQLLGRTLP